MKKYLFILAFLAIPSISHAQVGGSLPKATPAMSPAIERTHSFASSDATNPGAFEPSEMMNWDDAIDLANRMNRASVSLGTIAREAREQKAKETSAARVLSDDDLRRSKTSSNGVPGSTKP